MGGRARELTHKYTTAILLLCSAIASVSTDERTFYAGKIILAKAPNPWMAPTPPPVGNLIEEERIWNKRPIIEVENRINFITKSRPTTRRPSVFKVRTIKP